MWLDHLTCQKSTYSFVWAFWHSCQKPIISYDITTENNIEIFPRWYAFITLQLLQKIAAYFEVYLNMTFNKHIETWIEIDVYGSRKNLSSRDFLPEIYKECFTSLQNMNNIYKKIGIFQVYVLQFISRYFQYEYIYWYWLSERKCGGDELISGPIVMPPTEKCSFH